MQVWQTLSEGYEWQFITCGGIKIYIRISFSFLFLVEKVKIQNWWTGQGHPYSEFSFSGLMHGWGKKNIKRGGQSGLK